MRVEELALCLMHTWAVYAVKPHCRKGRYLGRLCARRVKAQEWAQEDFGDQLQDGERLKLEVVYE